jgi:hypothetical protein
MGNIKFDHSRSTDNWMLDKTTETLKKFGITNYELSKELTINKMEYGVICMEQQNVKLSTLNDVKKAIEKFKNK